MTNRSQFALSAAIAASLGLSACSSGPLNHSLDSVNQPVVEHQNVTLDLATSGNGLPIAEQRRLNDWFESMHLRYGDRVALDGPLALGEVRTAVAAIAGRYGMLLSDGAPVTEGYIAPGNVRVVMTRSHAYVPNCPDWSGAYNTTLGNATAAGYGCSVNGNVAAMVADPEHLLHGATTTGETVVMSSTKAIATYRAQDPTGKSGLPKVNTQSIGGGN
ncbi:MAG: CpaD family pilus assembly lipoprotein [Croceibacterium sp.]